MTLQNFKAVILLIISILIQQLHLELFWGHNIVIFSLQAPYLINFLNPRKSRRRGSQHPNITSISMV